MYFIGWGDKKLILKWEDVVSITKDSIGPVSSIFSSLSLKVIYLFCFEEVFVRLVTVFSLFSTLLLAFHLIYPSLGYFYSARQFDPGNI